MYDYLIVGSGLFGTVFAHEMRKRGRQCLVLEKRTHTGGNVYTEEIENIQVHKYGAHIFHTNNKVIWDYVNQFAEFNNFINSPLAVFKNTLYNLPFNMNTFYRMWGESKPSEVTKIINAQKQEVVGEPKNLEEQAISLVGRDIYETLIKGYTEKQWGRMCTELPPFIINRLPVRMTYDNNYFDDRYQGIPVGGYTKMISRMLEGCKVLLETDYLADRERWNKQAKKIIYTGPIDAYYQYCFGPLEYRSVRFETEVFRVENFQGNAVVNYTDAQIPYTRIIEHKHFEFGQQPTTVISKEYSEEWTIGREPYYPINDSQNTEVYNKYRDVADQEEGVVFGGRLGAYRYYNMDKVIEASLDCVESEMNDY